MEGAVGHRNVTASERGNLSPNACSVKTKHWTTSKHQKSKSRPDVNDLGIYGERQKGFTIRNPKKFTSPSFLATGVNDLPCASLVTPGGTYS